MSLRRARAVFARSAAAAVAFLTALAPVPCDAQDQSPKKILIVRGESPELIGGRVLVDAIMREMRQASGLSVEFYVETIDTARFSSTEYDERLADLYAAKYRQHPVDMVIAFSEPAADFVLRQRKRIFGDVPLLFGLVERRFLEGRDVPNNSGIVYVQFDPLGTLQLALATYPAARRVVVVGGTSRFDRAWERAVRDDLRSMATQIAIEYDTNSPLSSLLQRISALPRDTIVLFTSMTSDGSNTPRQPTEVVHWLREAAPVPIFGMASTHLGKGIVGGRLLDFDRHGTDLGRQAVRLAKGQRPERIVTPALTAVDWREMRRFGMTERDLPEGTLIAYRQPSLWQRERGFILTVLGVVALESGLIVALVWALRRRRETQRLLERRLQVEGLWSKLLSSLTSATPNQIDAALEATLTRVAGALEIEHVWRWRFDDALDRGWDSKELRAGRTLIFADASQLPPTIAERVKALGTGFWTVAVPLAPGGVVAGALFWSSRSVPFSWRATTSELTMIASLVSNVLERRHAERALEDSDRFKGAILDSLPAQVAVLDRNGTIIAVNHSWLRFGAENGVTSPDANGVGVSYVGTCQSAAREGSEEARQAQNMIESACRGEPTEERYLEYRCDTPEHERWFLMTVQPLRRGEGGAVVTHSDITARKLNELALRESEDRFRRMADALPVGIWMSEADGACSYYNESWLKMTGRSLDQLIGDGWLETLHPDDRDRCVNACLAAFAARERVSVEYRVRRQDGAYRWILDIGMPRFGTDGTFYGYVGGCIDLTDRKEAEQLLRDLSRSLMAAQDEERRRIARELHDHLSQQLALLAISLQNLTVHPPDSPAELIAALNGQWERTTEIASDVHAISHRLHPAKLEALGLVATMRAHCRDVTDENLMVRFSEQNIPAHTQPDVALCLFRVLEEALNNVVRHSGATVAEVKLSAEPAGIVLRVSDNGAGFRVFPRQRPSGLGLVSIRERVESLGGRVALTTTPGEGVVVEARVPFDPAQSTLLDSASRYLPRSAIDPS